MFCVITNQTDQLLRRLIVVTYASSQWRGNKFLIEHEMAPNMTDDLLNNDMRTGIHLLDAVWLKFDHFLCVRELGIICFYWPTLYVHWTEANLSCLNKTKLFSKVKELFMCFYVFCMNKNVVVGITLSVFLLIL